jgi:ankyrin repeat protein
VKEAKRRFFRALEKGDEDTAILLTQQYPQLAAESGEVKSTRFHQNAPAILIAAELGLGRALSYLLDGGADINVRGAYGGNALHWAAWNGWLGSVRVLIVKQTPIESTDTKHNCTPLYWTVHGFSYHSEGIRREQLQVARLLIDKGAQKNTSNADGTSAIDLLTDSADDEMKSLLLNYTANSGNR